MKTKYSHSIIDIMMQPFLLLDYSVVILSVVQNTASQTLFCKDIKHAQATFKVTINSIEYTIEDVNQNDESITVTGTGTITPGTFNLYPLYFYYGDAIEAGLELKKSDMASDKTPMFWMQRKFQQKFYEDISTSIERESSFSLFVLTQTQTNDYMVADSYHNCIEPMQRAAENLLAKMHEMTGLFNMIGLSVEIEDWTNLGVWLKEKGSVKLLWSEKLAGIEIKFSGLPIFRDGFCPDVNTGFGIGTMVEEISFVVS